MWWRTAYLWWSVSFCRKNGYAFFENCESHWFGYLCITVVIRHNDFTLRRIWILLLYNIVWDIFVIVVVTVIFRHLDSWKRKSISKRALGFHANCVTVTPAQESRRGPRYDFLVAHLLYCRHLLRTYCTINADALVVVANNPLSYQEACPHSFKATICILCVSV